MVCLPSLRALASLRSGIVLCGFRRLVEHRMFLFACIAGVGQVAQPERGLSSLGLGCVRRTLPRSNGPLPMRRRRRRVGRGAVRIALSGNDLDRRCRSG